jgi:hypothetical protein
VMPVPAHQSRYGYTWRGISRPQDRELGIAGGELIVIDLRNNEVLGYRRGFVITGNVKNVFTGIWWRTAGACPQNAREVHGKFQKFPHVDFIYSILRPPRDINRDFAGAAYDQPK